MSLQHAVKGLANVTYKKLLHKPYLTLNNKLKHSGFDIRYFGDYLNLVAFPKWNFHNNHTIIALNVNYLDTTEILEGLFMAILFRDTVKKLLNANKSIQGVNQNYVLYHHLTKNTKLGSEAINFANYIKKLDSKN